MLTEGEGALLRSRVDGTTLWVPGYRARHWPASGYAAWTVDTDHMTDREIEDHRYVGDQTVLGG